MVATINECLLNGQDYLFMTQSLTINNLNNEIERISGNLGFALFSSILVGVCIVLMIAFAVMIRPREKGGSNFLLAASAITVIAMSAMTYQSFDKKNALQSERADSIAILDGLDQPDPQIFDACIEPTAVLRELPDSEGISRYKVIINTSNN